MDHILRQQRGEDINSVDSNDKFVDVYAQVYSNDQESVLSNGQFKALNSVDQDDDEDDDEIEKGKDESSLLREEEREHYRHELRGSDDEAIHRCGSNDSQQYQSDNACMGCIKELFKINPKELVLKILAFSIPGSNPLLQTCCEQVPLPDSPGFICVGRVMTQTPHYCDIQFNDRVLVVLPVEHDAKYETYANVPFESAIKVPKNVDAMTQVSIVLTYLPALQILQTLPYKVKHKKVLLNGGVGPVIRSLIHLCILHGAKKIYVPCEKKYREDIRSIGGKTAGPKHHDWGPSYINEIDLVVDAIGENSYVTSRAVLNTKGHLCVIGNTDSALKGDGIFNSLNKMYLDYRVSNASRTTVFGLMSSIDIDRESFIQDFEYLSSLMDDGRIEPMFTKVSLDEYRKGEESDKATILNAPIICDPWAEYRWG